MYYNRKNAGQKLWFTIRASRIHELDMYGTVVVQNVCGEGQ